MLQPLERPADLHEKKTTRSYTDSPFCVAFRSTIPAMTIESASKLDAATRQLHMAIRLYFQDADPLAIHTLAGAAHGILADLARHRGHESGFQSTGAGVQTGQHAFVVRMIKEARVF